MNVVSLSIWDPKKKCKVLNPKAFEVEENMAEYKTILAPGAPWPTQVEKPTKPVKRVRAPRPPKDPSKQSLTDRMFEQWLAKNSGVNDGK